MPSNVASLKHVFSLGGSGLADVLDDLDLIVLCSVYASANGRDRRRMRRILSPRRKNQIEGHLAWLLKVLGGKDPSLVADDIAEAVRAAERHRAHTRSLTSLRDKLVRLADKARRKGILALEDEIPLADDPLLLDGLRGMTRGYDPVLLGRMMRARARKAAARRRQWVLACIEGCQMIHRGGRRARGCSTPSRAAHRGTTSPAVREDRATHRETGSP